MIFVLLRYASSHLPLMFVGMEHIMLSNHALADEALNAANTMCDGDPLLVNERGVMAFNRGECVSDGLLALLLSDGRLICVCCCIAMRGLRLSSRNHSRWRR